MRLEAGIMKNMADSKLSSANIQKDSLAIPMTLERAMKLSGLTEAPEDKWMQDFLILATADLVARHGEAWIVQNQERLREELEYLAEM